MKKLFLGAVALIALTPGLATAQSWREARESQREVQQSRAEVQRDIRRGDYAEARRDVRELREDRREAREDWRDYRESHRNVFRRGQYNGPRGYRYAPVNVGHRFAPTYYSSRYWISDPSSYRLPRPGYNQRWVRYGNDVVLINVRNGRVLQVYRTFFW